MTPGCTAEGQALRDRIETFRAKGVEVLGVSFDAPAANAAFARQEGFPFRLLSDRDRKLATAVGAADGPDQAAARRISYVVGPDGRVRKAYATVEPRGHAETVLQDLGAGG
jgi:peroxiredoxin Q/BCP